MAERPTREEVEALNPGSYKEFVEKYNITDSNEAILRHSEATHAYALALAAEASITLEELHTRTTDYSRSDDN